MTPSDKRKAVAQRAENALREMELNAVTQADKERCARVWRGLRSLDEEQADAKGECDKLRAQANRLRKAIEKALSRLRANADGEDHPVVQILRAAHAANEPKP